MAEACKESRDACHQEAEALLKRLCPDPGFCSLANEARRDYSWIEVALKRGVPDGRHRLILYVLSRYLVNVKGLSTSDAIEEVRGFLDRCCKNYGNCSKVYDSWIRNVLEKVKTGGWKPWTLERVKEKDPDLYGIIVKVLGGPEQAKGDN
ncbi:MAG: DNA primase noncatalytic subunit PriX [Acidilobus sp.]|uniref:DNA primase noncatalytic subunit PriX n=1 Tax=Acidilobus sp. 7A TaxID=1577685 RepID=UPI001B3BEE5E|nr:DNA primase noncatalytic subunit PriX [Acidilobus sp. 7A]